MQSESSLNSGVGDSRQHTQFPHMYYGHDNMYADFMSMTYGDIVSVYFCA